MSDLMPKFTAFIQNNRRAFLAVAIANHVTGRNVTERMAAGMSRHRITEKEMDKYIETMALARSFAVLADQGNVEYIRRLSALRAVEQFVRDKAPDQYAEIMQELGAMSQPIVEAQAEEVKSQE